MASLHANNSAPVKPAKTASARVCSAVPGRCQPSWTVTLPVFLLTTGLLMAAGLVLAAGCEAHGEEPPRRQQPSESAQPRSAEPRPHSAGPLRISEFRGVVPPREQRLVEDQEMEISAHTAVRFRFQFSSQEVAEGVRAELTEFTAYGVFFPADSWSVISAARQPEDATQNAGQTLDSHTTRLLDYAQGHLDLAEIWARRANLQLGRAIEDEEKSISVVAADRQEAASKLLESIEDRLLPIYSSLRREREYYGERTQLGKLRGEVERARAEHARDLEKLAEELRLLSPPSPTRPPEK